MEKACIMLCGKVWDSNPGTLNVVWIIGQILDRAVWTYKKMIFKSVSFISISYTYYPIICFNGCFDRSYLTEGWYTFVGCVSSLRQTSAQEILYYGLCSFCTYILKVQYKQIMVIIYTLCFDESVFIPLSALWLYLQIYMILCMYYTWAKSFECSVLQNVYMIWFIMMNHTVHFNQIFIPFNGKEIKTPFNQKQTFFYSTMHVRVYMYNK